METAKRVFRTDIHPVTAVVMAGDYEHMERVDLMFQAGEVDLERALMLIGSYARMDWVVRQLQLGKVKPEQIYPRLPALWSGSDPDDTDARFLELWKAAWRANDNVMLLGERAFPAIRKKLIPVYRGEVPDAPLPGIAWTLDRSVARKFARGAGARVPTEGDVLMSRVRRKDILAYIGDRGESEVILDPFDLIQPPVTLERWRFQVAASDMTNENK